MRCAICGSTLNTHFNNKHKEWWCNKCSTQINNSFSIESEGWMSGTVTRDLQHSIEKGYEVVTDSRKEYDKDD
jgi:hypothetical protein